MSMRYDWINCCVRVWFEPVGASPYFREGSFQLPDETTKMEKWVGRVTREYMEKSEDGNVSVEYMRKRPMRQFMKRAEKKGDYFFTLPHLM